MKKIAVTGYYGTGSSAVIDLLMEYSTCSSIGIDPYEHLAFYHPNGIFDLEDKLLRGNDIHRADEALGSFRRDMMKLSKNNFGWFGSYEEIYGDKFNKLVDEFLEDIPNFKIKGKWYGQYKGVRFSLIKVILQLGAKIIQKRKIYKWGRQYVIAGGENMTVAFPTEEEYFKAARKFVKGYLDLIGGEKNDSKHIVFDHLVLPHNAYRIPNYFDDDFRLIIIDRDARDMYALANHVWPAINAEAPFPKDINEYIDFWGRVKKTEKPIDDPRILRINFEELVYEYDSVVERIEQFIGLDPKDHVKKKQIFNPEKSIKNTQNFKIEKDWEREGKIIGNALPEYIYKFPYEIETSIKETFDL